MIPNPPRILAEQCVECSAPAAGMEVKHACYAHLWDASRTRLFVCGGPLAFGLAGCYMAVWH